MRDMTATPTAVAADIRAALPRAYSGDPGELLEAVARAAAERLDGYGEGIMGERLRRAAKEFLDDARMYGYGA